MPHNTPSPSLPVRLLRHLRSTRTTARRAFPSTTLKAIQASIGEGEQRHRAQVRVIVEAALSLGAVRRGESARQRAHELFSHYRIWDTEENCGVLVYINLADRKVEIVADRGVGARITRGQWQEVCAVMVSGFRRGEFEQASLLGLARLNALLTEAMPLREGGGGNNELSDKPVLL